MRFLRLAFILIFLHPGLALHAATEGELKAAYVLKFATFVTWPDDAPTNVFTIGVAGSSDIARHVERAAVGLRVRNRPVIVKRVTSQADATGCQLVYFASEKDASILAGLRGSAVLTVGESDSFCSKGGIIGLKQVGTKLRFTINQTTASKARLGLSAQLLRLALPE